MREHRTCWAILAGMVLMIAVGPGSSPAVGQILPPIPVPEPPEAVVPVLEVLGPIANTQCANAQAGLLLGLALGGGVTSQLPIEVSLLDELGPVFVLCGSIPAPDQKYRCVADDLIRGLIDQPLQLAAGLTSPVAIDLMTQLIGTTYVIQDQLPPLQGLPDLVGTIAPAVQCAPVVPDDGASGGAPTTAPSTTIATEPTSDPSEVAAPRPAASNPSPPAVVPRPATPAASATPVRPPSAVAEPDAPLSPIASVFSFQYPGAFLLPFLLIALGTYLGKSFTRSLTTVD